MLLPISREKSRRISGLTAETTSLCHKASAHVGGPFLEARRIARRDALILLEKPFDKAAVLEIHFLVVRFKIGEREMARSMQYVGEECAIRGDGTGFKCQPHELITSGTIAYR